MLALLLSLFVSQVRAELVPVHEGLYCTMTNSASKANFSSRETVEGWLFGESPTEQLVSTALEFNKENKEAPAETLRAVHHLDGSGWTLELSDVNGQPMKSWTSNRNERTFMTVAVEAFRSEYSDNPQKALDQLDVSCTPWVAAGY